MTTDTKKRGRPPKKESMKELEKVETQIKDYEEKIKSLNLDEMNKAPINETEPQTQLSQKEIRNSKDIYLKPVRRVGSFEKFNERFRDQYEFDREYVHFTAENNEAKGDTIECWTKPYPGLPAEFWMVPVNKPIWGPRYLAEQIRKCSYHRLKIEAKPQDENMTGHDAMGSYYGSVIVDTTEQRLNAHPVYDRPSVFISHKGF